MDVSIKANCTWNRSGGSELSKVIQTSLAVEDIFVKPELSDILSEDRAILLTKPTDTTKACEICIGVQPSFKFAALSIVCTAPKVELFLAAQYFETVYGKLITDEDGEDDSDPNETEQVVQSYRYDIEIEKSGVVELTVKLLTATDEICIYGIVLQIAPNPNGITTLTPPNINLDNVEEMLKNSNQKISPNAEKCKLFLETFCRNQAKLNKSCENPAAILEHLKMTLGTPTATNMVSNENVTENTIVIETTKLEKVLKAHIDCKLNKLEEHINARLDKFEEEQKQKLNKIVEMLESIKENKVSP